MDISSVFNSAKYTNASSFALANDCNSFRIDGDFYRADAGTNNSYVAVSNAASYSDWTAADQDFNFIVRKDREIWKYNSTINQYGLYYTFNNTHANLSLTSFQNRVVVTSFMQNDEIQIFVLNSPNNVTPKLLFTKTISHLASPSVKLSPNLTKIIVFGYDLGNSSNPKTLILHIDYTKANSGVVSIDSFISSFNIEKYFEFIEDNFMYFRVFDSNNTNNFECLYYFSANKKTHRIFTKPIVSIEGL